MQQRQSFIGQPFIARVTVSMTSETNVPRYRSPTYGNLDENLSLSNSFSIKRCHLHSLALLSRSKHSSKANDEGWRSLTNEAIDEKLMSKAELSN